MGRSGGSAKKPTGALVSRSTVVSRVDSVSHLLVGRQIKSFSDIIRGGYLAPNVSLKASNGGEVHVSVSATNYGHNDFGSFLAVHTEPALANNGKTRVNPSHQDDFLTDQSGNSISINPNIPRLVKDCRKDSELDKFVSGKTVLAVSDYSPGDISLQIDFSDQSSLRISVYKENYGHGDMGERLAFTLIEGIDKKKLKENDRLVKAKEMLNFKKRDIAKNQQEIVEFIKEAGKEGDPASREITEHVLSTTKENMSLDKWLNKYSDLIISIPPQRVVEWVRGPEGNLSGYYPDPGLSEQERTQIRKYLDSNKFFTAKERSRLKVLV